MNNNLNFLFGMYEPTTDSVIVNAIVYLYRLAKGSPLTYAKLALKENGLQDYVDAMNELN